MTLLNLKTERKKVDESINNHLRRQVDERDGFAPLEDGSAGQAASPGVNPISAPARTFSGLADGLSRCLMNALENIQVHLESENQRISGAQQEQLDRLQSAVDGLKDLWAPVEELLTAVAEQRKAASAASERFDRLASIAASLHESDARKQGEIERLREENRELRTALNAHGEELTGLKTAFADTSRRVAGTTELLERQGEVLRQLRDVESNRAAVLERAFADLARTKSAAA